MNGTTTLTVATLCFASPALCQQLELLWRVEGVGGLINRGTDVHRLGDFNGDGWDDLLELGERWNGQARENAMRFISGQDGSILSSANPIPLYWAFGNIAPMGDMNQDGVPDYGARIYYGLGAPPTPYVAVFSGATHTLLWTATIPNGWNHYFAAALCGELDVNGDGRNDVVTNAPNFSPYGAIFVYDNAGIELYRLVDPVPSLWVLDVASLKGDLDGDGCSDFVASAAEPLNRGAIVCFSGRTGAVLRVSYGAQPGDKLVNAGACGDVDRDGVPDYCGGGSFGAGVVTAFSGATGQIIHSWRETGCCMGINVIGGYDLDQDGVPDLAAGTLNVAMNAYSGRDGTFLGRWPATHYVCSGESVAMIAPPPGEQYPVIVFSERCWGGSPANGIAPGAVWAFRGCPPGVRRYGLPDRSAASQPLARSGMRGLTVASTPTVRFTMSEAPAGSAAVLLLGTSNTAFGGVALPLGLDALGYPGITLWTSVDASLLFSVGTTGMGAGYAEYNLALPTGHSLSTTGTPFFAQWLWLDLNQFANHGSTAGQRFRIQ